MKKFLAQIFIVFVTIFLCLSFLVAEDETNNTQPDWKFTLEDCHKFSLSPDGKHFFICHDLDDECAIDMYDMHSAKKLWTKKLTGLSDEKFYDLWRFVSSEVLFAGDENGYLFLNVNDGSVLKSIPLICKSWDDILLKTGKAYNFPSPEKINYGSLEDVISDMIKHPIFIRNYGIFFSGDGFQVINFSEQNVLYQSTQPCSKIRTEEYYENSSERISPLLKINVYSGGVLSSMFPDSSYALDYENNKFYTFFSPDGEIINKDIKPNNRLYITNFSHKTDRIDFCSNSITYTNLTTNKIEKTLNINPNEPDFISPVLYNDQLCFITSQDKIQTLYDGKTLTPIFKTNPNDLPGIIDQFYSLENGDVLLLVYNNDDSKMSIGRVDSKTGKIVWKNTIFKYEGSFKPGHQRESGGAFAIKLFASVVVSYALRASPLHLQYSPNDEAIISSLNKEKKSEGYANILSLSNDTLIFVASGKINSELGQANNGDYNGEGIISINMKTGKILQNYSCPIIANSKIENVIGKLICLYFPQVNSNIIVGTNDIYIQNRDNIERISFGKSKVNFINSDSISVTVAVVDDEENNTDYWRVLVGENKARKTLLARSKLDPFYFEDIFIPIFSPLLGNTKYDEFPCSLYIDENGISGYKLIESEVNMKSDIFSSPLWKFSFEELDLGTIDIKNVCEDYLDKLKDSPYFNPKGEVQGLIVNKDGVIILGSDKIGYIKPDGSCNWEKEWEPDIDQSTIGVNDMNGHIFYSIGDHTKMYSTDCAGETLISFDSDYNDTVVLIPNDNSGLFVKKNDSEFEFYKFK